MSLTVAIEEMMYKMHNVRAFHSQVFCKFELRQQAQLT